MKNFSGEFDLTINTPVISLVRKKAHDKKHHGFLLIEKLHNKSKWLLANTSTSELSYVAYRIDFFTANDKLKLGVAGDAIIEGLDKPLDSSKIKALEEEGLIYQSWQLNKITFQKAWKKIKLNKKEAESGKLKYLLMGDGEIYSSSFFCSYTSKKINYHNCFSWALSVIRHVVPSDDIQSAENLSSKWHDFIAKITYRNLQQQEKLHNNSKCIIL